MDILDFLTQNPNIFLMLIAALSLIMGSFLNVVIYRMPRMIEHEWSLECREYLGLKTHSHQEVKPLSLYLPFSHCPHCQKTLKPWHNIPVISYLVLRGKCAYCKGRISMRYPLVEALCCFASVYVAWRFGVSLQTLAGLFFTWTLIALTFIDLDYHLLPDQLTFFLVGLGLFFSLFAIFCNSTDAIIGLLIGYLIFAVTQWIFHYVTGKIGMGQGDYKFLAGLGAFLGWQMIPVIVLLASILGVIFTIGAMIIKNQFKSVPVAFGPYLALASWISLMWGNEIVQLYLNVVR